MEASWDTLIVLTIIVLKVQTVSNACMESFKKQIEVSKKLDRRKKQGDVIINSIYMDDFTETFELINITFDILVTFAVNYCGYSSSERDMVINWVHQLFLK